MHTGKSTLAQQLASRLNLPNVLQTDIVYEVCPVACSQHCMSLSCIHALPQEQACCSCMSTDESDVLLMLHDECMRLQVSAHLWSSWCSSASVSG